MSFSLSELFSVNPEQASLLESRTEPKLKEKKLSMAVKRAMDITGALCFILVALPFFILGAVLVRMDGPGSIIFRQTRNGINGQEFTIFKFRTMVVHADKGDVIEQARPGDARVTRIGRLLRNTSLDEIPQLFNVLKGDMSLVGPRPHAVSHNEYYTRQIHNYHLRHGMKPGMTGLAQVSGWRGATDTIDKMEGRVACDLYYIDQWSLWLDFKILLMTFITVLFHKNAH